MPMGLERWPGGVKPLAPLEVEWFVRIKGKVYAVKLVPPGDPAVFKQYRFTSESQSVYDVVDTENGVLCDCPDYTFRTTTDRQYLCKHIRALIEGGMLLLLEE